MAALVGSRETLMPTGTKRKRARKTPDPRESDTVTSQDTEEAVSSQDDSSKAKRKKKSSPKTATAPPAVVANSKPVKAVDTNSHAEDWSKEEVSILLGRIKDIMPLGKDSDNVKYSTQAEKLNWETVKFEKHTAQECKEKWITITTKLRRFRTMKELLVDAEVWVKTPWSSFGKKGTQKHPDMPKKPLTPYFRYFMEKRKKMAQQHPSLSMTEISKMLAEKFRQLPDKKKQKFIDGYSKDNEGYKVALAKFREEHPEFFTDSERDDSKSVNNNSSDRNSKSSNSGPPKSTTALAIFLAQKTEEMMKKDTSMTKKQITEKLRLQWSEMVDSKKIKFIEKAMEAKGHYDVEMEEYCKSHPDFKPKVVKSFLSKIEQRLIDKKEGKPDKPPPNGYGLYSSILLQKLVDIPSTERMAEVSRRWKALSDPERADFNRQAIQRNLQYKELYAKYVASLPPAEREKLGEDASNKKSAGKTSAASPPGNNEGTDRPKKPMAALYLFMAEQRDKTQKKYPTMTDQELSRLLIKEYQNLHEDKKARYKKMEAEQKAAYAQKSQTNAGGKKESKAKNRLFPGEPKKPPASGYGLFSAEQLVKLKTIPSHERMAVISQKWKVMSESEKGQYKKLRDTMAKQYEKDMDKFKNNLSSKDRKRFEELEASRRRGTKASPKKKNAQPEESDHEAETDSESEAESDSDSEDSDAESDAESDGSGDDNDSEESSGEEEIFTIKHEDATLEPFVRIRSQDGSDDSEEEDSGSGSEYESESEPGSPPAAPIQNGPTSKVKTNSTSPKVEESESESEAEGSDSGSESSGSDSSAVSGSESESE